MPSASIATPSPVNVPMTRLVKKPRLSLTTIGVLRNCRTTPRARSTAASLVVRTLDHLDQRHLVHRREEVQPDEVGLPAHPVGEHA